MVLFKKGDKQDAENYRPISLLSILYKLFAKLVDKRIGPILDAAQSVDQAGFRSGFGCEDHLFTITHLVQTANEYQLPLWVAAVDFQKAFDSVEHASLWTNLRDMGVPAAYIRVLASLYILQSGEIITDKTSKKFAIRRGTKQGDPLSPKLFNAVLEGVLRKLKVEWSAKGYGVRVQPETAARLTNLRFADDILSIASSKDEAQDMLASLARASSEVGLQIHLGKTKLLSNIPDAERGYLKKIEVAGGEVEVVPYEDAVMYLGRSLSLGRMQEEELRHRIARAWSKFHQFKKELCGRYFPLLDRLRLFEAVVTPSVLYACGTWTMNSGMECMLRSAQRQMLRKYCK